MLRIVLVSLLCVACNGYADERLDARVSGSTRLVTGIQVYQRGAYLPPEIDAAKSEAKWNLPPLKTLVDNVNLLSLIVESRASKLEFGSIEVHYKNTTSTLKLHWPKVENSDPVPSKVARSDVPHSKTLLLLDWDGNALRDVPVVVFYASSKRKETYLSDREGRVKLSDSVPEKADGVGILYIKGELEVYLKGKQDWSSGSVVFRPKLEPEL